MIYGYCRVSTTMQSEDGESLGVQQRQIAGWAMMRGEDVATMFVERGVSGSTPILKRPEGAQMFKVARKGDIIVCARLDRLFRSALDALQTCEDMQRRGVEIHVIEGLGNITTNGMGKAFMTIAATFAELERDTIRERITTVKADQRQRGRYLGGRVPFGFRVEDGELVEDEEQQRMIEVAKEGKAQGLSLRAIQQLIGDRLDRSIALPTLSKIVNDRPGSSPSGVRITPEGQIELSGPRIAPQR